MQCSTARRHGFSETGSDHQNTGYSFSNYTPVKLPPPPPFALGYWVIQFSRLGAHAHAAIALELKMAGCGNFYPILAGKNAYPRSAVYHDTLCVTVSSLTAFFLPEDCKLTIRGLQR